MYNDDTISVIAEFLRPGCLVPLRFVSKQCRRSVVQVHEIVCNDHKIANYLSSIALYVWAISTINMPLASREEIHEFGCLNVVTRWHEEHPELVADAGTGSRLQVMRFWNDCECAARGGRLEVLQFVRSRQPHLPWSEATCTYAAEYGHLHLLMWLRNEQTPCPWNEETCARAAESGHIRVLDWLRSQSPPCPWSAATCSCAAATGRISTLQWLRSQSPPCPWDERACMFAALVGLLHVLRWMRSQNPQCPWDERTFAAAAESGNADLLRWLQSQDPPRSPSADDYFTEDLSGFDGYLSMGSDEFEDCLLDD